MSKCLSYEQFKDFQNNLLNHYVECIDKQNKNKDLIVFLKCYSKDIRHCYCETLCPFYKECDLKENI